jgi:hypothetical protein
VSHQCLARPYIFNTMSYLVQVEKKINDGFVTGFVSLGPGARRFLVSLEKEFKDGHRGDLNRSRFVNGKSSKGASCRRGRGQA